MPGAGQQGQGGNVVITRVLADPVRMYLPKEYWNRARDWFVFNCDYSSATAVLAVSAVAQEQSFQTQNDSDFLVLAIVATSATVATPPVENAFQTITLQIRDTGSSANWFDRFTNIQNIAGRMSMGSAGSQSPGLLEHPRFVPAASQVTTQLTNLTATAAQVWVSFRGIKIYRTLQQAE